jgi:uncharacterized protein (TIGR02145 family)
LYFVCSILPYSQETETFTDFRDGKIYRIAKIGKHVWMTENLALKTKNVVCWTFGNRSENLEKYGYLYPREGAKFACPDGWRLTSKNDFDSLLLHAEGSDLKAYDFLTKKDIRGFSATFGGFREENEGFINKDYTGIYWS